MNLFKKKITYFGLVILFIILFRGYLYQLFINYSVIDTRANITLIKDNLTKEIDKKISGKTLSIEEVIKLSNDITSEKLSFTFDKVSSNPNKSIDSRKANCIGYSSLFNSIKKI